MSSPILRAAFSTVVMKALQMITIGSLAKMGNELEIMKLANFEDRRYHDVDLLLKKFNEKHLGRILTSTGALIVSTIV